MKPQKITRLYAWIAEEPDGGEGIVSAQIGDIHMPLIGADRARIESFRNIAKAVHLQTFHPIKLAVFDCMTIIEEL
jgi:hypothetical protein